MDRQLTRRQLKVLKLTAQGYVCKQIAAVLRIRQTSVAQHRACIYKRIGARNTADATRWAIAYGVIKVPTPEAWR